MTRLILITAICLAGCDKPASPPKDEYQVAYSRRVQVVTIDGCEYLYGPWNQATVLTHKGNCSNPIHHHREAK